MDYKKILKSQDVRFKILNSLSSVPDSMMIKIQYFMKLNKFLNLKKPKNFTEKIQWMKLNYRNPEMKICVDKYEVRNFIKKKNLEEILVDLYQVCDQTDKIDIGKLPQKFI
ncbi:hypothetical protein [Vagococcus jeotgali]|uniref:hypothetical protein n=1 Tax=Vagococcus jeotgali TaxID=3109030 RepID=UPI002DDBCD2B|nr:hypothetical protein [Vagococcus sp. B2T-5]